MDNLMLPSYSFPVGANICGKPSSTYEEKITKIAGHVISSLLDYTQDMCCIFSLLYSVVSISLNTFTD